MIIFNIIDARKSLAIWRNTVNQPRREVATTEGNTFGSSPERDATSNIPKPYLLTDHSHHPTNGYSSSQNVDDAFKALIAHLKERYPEIKDIAKHIIFCSDYDGTLAPAGLPNSTTRPQAGVKKVIQRLVSMGVAWWNVSGKDVSNLHRLLPVKGTNHCGLFGLEYLDENGHSCHSLVTEEQLANVSSALKVVQNWANHIDVPGLEIEDQGHDLTIDGTNYRRTIAATVVWKGCRDEANPFDIDKGLKALKAFADEHGLQLNVGHGYANLVPFFAGKDGFLEHSINDVVVPDCKKKIVVFLGDEKPDVEAFRKLEAMYQEGTIAGFLCLGVTNPVYERVELTPPNAPEERIIRMLSTGEHKIDPDLSLDDLHPDDHRHFILPGPEGVARSLYSFAKIIKLARPFNADLPSLQPAPLLMAL